MAAFVGNDQRALKLAGIGCVDAEVRRKLHRAAHALRHVDERSVREHCRIQCGEVVVRIGDDAAEVLLDQFRVVLHGVRERAEDHARPGQLVLERRRDRDAVEYGVDGDTGKTRPLVQWHAELLVRREQLGIDFVEALRAVRSGPRCRVIRDRLVVDGRDAQVGPVRVRHRVPVPQRLQAPVEHELRLTLDLRDDADHVLVEAGRQRVGFDVSDEAVLILLGDECVEVGRCAGHP